MFELQCLLLCLVVTAVSHQILHVYENFSTCYFSFFFAWMILLMLVLSHGVVCQVDQVLCAGGVFLREHVS